MARPLDRRESPWYRTAHSREVKASVPKEIYERFVERVEEEKRTRGKFSMSAAIREAVDQWLSRR